MNIVLSFIGKMPTYVVECVTQARLFFKGNIYLIYNDIDAELMKKLEGCSLIFVHYDLVVSKRFNEKFNASNFHFCNRLEGREQLFMRSYERFYLLDELMKLYSLRNVWFMEIDILLYVDPSKFLPVLETKPYVYSYHRQGHFNTGICFVRSTDDLQPVLESLDSFSDGFRSEMVAFNFHYFRLEKKDCLFPLLMPVDEVNRLYYKDFSEFDNHLFDGAIMGMYYFGIDSYHTDGRFEIKNPLAYGLKDKFLNVWKYGDLKWKKNDAGHYLPYYITMDDVELPVVNLHIHSKNLIAAVSYTEKTDTYE